MNKLFTAAALVALPIQLASCGISSNSAVQSAAAVDATTTKALYEVVAAMTPAMRASRITMISNLTIPAYYTKLRAITTDAPLEIDGQVVSGMASRITAAWPRLMSLAQTYPNMGALWAAQGYDPSRALASSDLSTSLQILYPAPPLSSLKTLALTIDTKQLMNLPSGPACAAPTVVTPDLSAATAGSYFWTSPSGDSLVLNPSGTFSVGVYTAAFDEALSDVEPVSERQGGYGSKSLTAEKKIAPGVSICRKQMYCSNQRLGSTYYSVIQTSAYGKCTDTLELGTRGPGTFRRTTKSEYTGDLGE